MKSLLRTVLILIAVLASLALILTAAFSLSALAIQFLWNQGIGDAAHISLTFKQAFCTAVLMSVLASPTISVLNRKRRQKVPVTFINDYISWKTSLKQKGSGQ